ncbi:cytochrome c biogenesis protein CcdA [Methanocaldococcus indicus]|uniref:cytochrome c biogenesis protein CcdA n=1 Tax=Methanocaldococcus indicus TaxID=213231 RepID=UPI003C6D35B3
MIGCISNNNENIKINTNVINLTTDKNLTILVFEAEWCGYCKALKPTINKLKEEGYNVIEIDVDKNKELAQKFGVKYLPITIKRNSKIFNKITKIILENNKTKYFGSFLFGFFYGVLANTCADPVLVSILSYIATKQDILFGFISLFIYALGFGTPLIFINLVGIEIKEILEKINFKLVNKISGLILIILGIYILLS